MLCHEHCHNRRSWTQDDVSFASHLADLVERAMEAADRTVVERALHQLNRELEQRIDERARQLEEATELVLRLQKKSEPKPRWRPASRRRCRACSTRRAP